MISIQSILGKSRQKPKTKQCEQINTPNQSIRAYYEELGVDGFYSKHSNDYSNPHIKSIEQCINLYIHSEPEPNTCLGKSLLDLSCGSGEVTNIIKSIMPDLKITGCDPYTNSAYRKNTGCECLEYTFKDIATDSLNDKYYDTVLCSYAMHLCEISMLNSLIYNLSQICNQLIIISPNKRPEISEWFTLKYSDKVGKSAIRVYISNYNQYK
jgi:SAM-dependent methyltransferase